MTKNYISQDSAARKRMPMAAGLLDYFPAALAAVAEHSFVGNEKHNPGQELHWSRGNSTDHADCIARHLIERGAMEEVTFNGHTYLVRHSAALAWRALALLQEELEAEGAAPGRGSRFPKTSGHVNAMPLSYGSDQWRFDELAKARGNIWEGVQWELTPKAHAAIEDFNKVPEFLKPKKRVEAALPGRKKKAPPKPRRKRG